MESNYGVWDEAGKTGMRRLPNAAFAQRGDKAYLEAQERKKARMHNPTMTLADLLHRINFIEKAGTGIRRILEDAKEQNCPRPDFEIGRFVTVTFRPNPEVRAIGTDNQPAGEVTGEVTEEVTPKVSPTDRLLQEMSGEMTRQQIQDATGLKHENHFRNVYLIPALQAGWIEMTIPDKPRSSKQRYRLTPAGVERQKQGGKDGKMEEVK